MSTKLYGIPPIGPLVMQALKSFPYRTLVYFTVASILFHFALLDLSKEEAPSLTSLRVAGGKNPGVYYSFSKALDAAYSENKPKVDLVAEETDGSNENANRVSRFSPENKKIAYGLVQSDIQNLGLNVSLVAKLYDEYLHIIVRDSSELRIGDLSDLKDRKVAIGSENMGSNQIARNLFKVAGIKPKLLDDGYDNIEDLIGKIRNPNNDLVAGVILRPIPDITITKEISKGGVKILSLEVKDFDSKSHTSKLSIARPLAVMYPDYFEYEIPSLFFGRKQNKPIKTIYVSALLVANNEVPNADVKHLCSVLFGNRKALEDAIHGLTSKTFISPLENILRGLNLQSQTDFKWKRDFHPGAKEFYSRSKISSSNEIFNVFRNMYAYVISMLLFIGGVIGWAKNILKVRGNEQMTRVIKKLGNESSKDSNPDGELPEKPFNKKYSSLDPNTVILFAKAVALFQSQDFISVDDGEVGNMSYSDNDNADSHRMER